MNTIPVKRALLSVSDKAGIIEFAQHLRELNIDIISTGGTSKLLREAGIAHRAVEEVTDLPEMLGGRVKTLHPKIQGAILGRRDNDLAEARQYGLEWIDLVVVNFYPFAQAIKDRSLSFSEAIEYIDIGGPTMVRAAAKNSAWVGVVIDPADYAEVWSELKEQHGLSAPLRRRLAQKVFAETAHYDALIAAYMAKEVGSDNQPGTHLHLGLEKASDLRYGENPHQKAHAYQFITHNGGILTAKQHQGKPLSFNNIIDSEAARNSVCEFAEPACVIVKHANPCGVATGVDIEEAFSRALAADPVSAFGGIIALNKTCTKELAANISKVFMEVVLAPSFTLEALEIFTTKPNLRVLQIPLDKPEDWEMKFINGGLLLQERDSQTIAVDELQVVTQAQPSADDMENMLFAWRVLKHIKSNGILLAKDYATVGIGAGQVSRIDAVDIAVRKADKNIAGSVLASDAFFPFRDSIDRIAQTGVRAIIQPGGSVRDAEVIAACNEHGIAMVFTGKRCFKH
jgi:phosphoribosylaminoimidazolecarboxamide formyltransferase/IMP cyclohydrolase